MKTKSQSKWGVRLATWALWALAGGSVAFWGLRLAGRAPAVLVTPAAPAAIAPDTAALARLLGAPTGAVARPAAPAVSTRFALIGVLVGRASGGGAALIAVDNQPAKPFRVGAQVADGLFLQALGPRQARLGPKREGPATVTLEIPTKG